MSKIHSNTSIKYLLPDGKKQKLKNEKNTKAFIDYSQKTNMFTKLWKTIIQQRKGEC